MNTTTWYQPYEAVSLAVDLEFVELRAAFYVYVCTCVCVCVCMHVSGRNRVGSIRLSSGLFEN